jgi:hypothetical protein
MTTLPAPNSLAGQFWAAVLATLQQRGMLRSAGQHPIYPHALAGIETDRCVIFVLDMTRLGNIPREEWLDEAWQKQLSSTLGGRKVFVVDTAGLFLVISNEPQEHQSRRLPGNVLLDITTMPPEKFSVPVGVGRKGPVWMTLADLDSVLVGGARRMGKSTWLNSVLYALLARHTPQELQLVLVDPKMVELLPWAGVPHLMVPPATEVPDIARVLQQLYDEIQSRRVLFADAGVRKLSDYNAKADRPLPAILLVVDELADLAMLSGGTSSDVMRLLTAAVTKGGAFGVHGIIATQRPDSSAIAGVLKANVATRLSFWLPGDLDYRLVLQPPKGTVLPPIRRIPGRMIARLPDRPLQVLQAYYVSDEMIRVLVQQLAGGSSGEWQLDDLEADLVEYAAQELGGNFVINRLYDAFKGEISKRRLEELARTWERRGWLTPPRDAVSPRRVTPTLLRLAGLAPGRENDDTMTGVTGGDRGRAVVTGR